MCLDILRNPVKSLMDAKKNSPNKTLTVLLGTSVLFGVSAGILVAKTGLYDLLLAGSIITVFLMALIGMMLFGLVIYIVATTLGGRGRYLQGLTATSYSMVPVSVGAFIISLLAWIPFTVGVQIVVLALTLALGISLLHRGIKELYRTDMITSFVAVSISALAVLMAIYVSVGLSLLGRLAAGVL